MPEVTQSDFARLENKVDRLAAAIEKLVLIEERQLTQGQRLGALEQRVSTNEAKIEATDRKVDTWINRGIGVWALAVVAWAVFKQVWK